MRCGAPDGAALLHVSESGQFGAGRLDALLVGTEIDDQGDPVLDAGDRAEAVLVMSDPIVHRVRLSRRVSGFWNVEGAALQVAPGPGAERGHQHQYAPTWPRRHARSAEGARISRLDGTEPADPASHHEGPRCQAADRLEMRGTGTW
jgi:hypothetical protein